MRLIHRRLLRAALAVSFGVTAVASAPRAEASGYLTARFGGDLGGPMMPNTYAIYFNPAALGGSTGTTIVGDASLVLRQAHYTRTPNALSPSNPELLGPESGERGSRYRLANTGEANLLNLLALPFVGVNTDFGTKNLRGGFAVHVPFGGLATWDRDRGIPSAPGSADGVSRWHNISGQILAIYNSFALAYKLGDSGFSIGASVSPVIHHVATVRAKNGDNTDDIEDSTGTTVKEGRSYLDATGVNIQATAGVYWQSDKLRVGAAYLSQPGFGDTRIGGKLDAVAGGATRVKEDIDFIQTYPDIVRLGVALKATDKLELRMDGDFVRWSVFENQCVVRSGGNCNLAPDGSSNNPDIILNIPRRWKNAFGYRAGAAYAITDKLDVSGSLAISTSAVPKETIDASTIDSFRFYATVGGRYALSDHLALGAAYTHIYFVPVDTNGRQNLNEYPLPSTSPSADGKYTSQIGFLNLNVAYTF